MRLFLIFFVSVPLVEIFLFLKVGEFIGSFQTISLIIITAVIGGLLVRKEGIKTFNNLRVLSTSEPKKFLEALGDGLFVLISGVLLITPGFATDILGFIFFLKLPRNYFIKILIKKVNSLNSSKFNRND